MGNINSGILEWKCHAERTTITALNLCRLILSSITQLQPIRSTNELILIRSSTLAVMAFSSVSETRPICHYLMQQLVNFTFRVASAYCKSFSAIISPRLSNADISNAAVPALCVGPDRTIN